jgi:hypothetical protein
MNDSNFFSKNKYCVIKNIAEKSLVDCVTGYALLQEAYSFSPDSNQVVGAHAVYADFLMESLLLNYQPAVESATGLSLLPTYSFYRVYRRGNELTPHKDRESCEISMTVSYGFDYRGKDYKWPIHIDGNPVLLEPGDGAVYRGCEVEHWRDLLDVPQDSYHVQCFYHYVDKNGPNAEYAYDKKNSSHLKYLQDKSNF